MCSLPLTVPVRGIEHPVFCSGCRREVTAVVWPALDRAVVRTPLPQAMAAGEAACFSCSDTAATGVCEGCGCYTCTACEAAWFGESLCLTCLHARRELMAAPKFRHRTLLHDNVALMLLLLPIIGIPFYGLFFAVLASPVALFLVLRHRKAPRGLPPRGPFRLILAGTLAVLLMLSVLAGIGSVIYTVVGINQEIRSWDETAPTGPDVDASGEPNEVPAVGGAVPAPAEDER